MSIQRWTPLVNGHGRAQMYATPDGPWISYSDHVAAVAKAADDEWEAGQRDGREDAIRNAIATVMEMMPSDTNPSYNDAVMDAVAALRALLDGGAS